MKARLIYSFLLLSLVLAACQARAPLQQEGEQVAGEQNSIAPTGTSIPTNTPTSTATLTPEPTSTPVPPTPTIEPPAIVIEFLDGVEILSFDGFDTLENWSTWNSGSGGIAGGIFELTGQEGWSSGLVLRRKIREGDGIILSFKTVNNARFKSEFVFTSGTWQTDSFRQFGVYNGQNPKADLFQGKYGLGFNNLYGNLTPKADTWYKLLMAVGKGGEFLAVVWDPDDPSRRVFYNENIGEKWERRSWEFNPKATEGETVYIDDFSRISFDAMK